MKYSGLVKATEWSTILEKNVRKNGLCHLCLKIKLLKALEATTTPFFRPENNDEVRLDHC